MTRQADSTIKGFLYQFNKTLKEILELAPDEEVLVEGIIEDIDILLKGGDVPLRSIQCKYHESAENFTPSLIYKPVLQMLEGYAKGVSADNLVIFIHVQNAPGSCLSLTKQHLNEILSTENSELSKIINRTTGPIDQDDFVKKLKIEFGPSISQLEEKVKLLLSTCFKKEVDVEGISYPNAINIIAKLSSEKSAENRKISKNELIKKINSTKEVIFTKWIAFTNSKQKTLSAMRRSLAQSLNPNSSTRHIYLCNRLLIDFDTKIVAFIARYIDKYHCKPAHINPPLFVINAEKNYISQIVSRLYARGIIATEGVVGTEFFLDRLLRAPINKRNRLPQDADFRVRICGKDIFPGVLQRARPDYLYIVADSIPLEWDYRDVCHHHMALDNFEELEYVFSLRGATNV